MDAETRFLSKLLPGDYSDALASGVEFLARAYPVLPCIAASCVKKPVVSLWKCSRSEAVIGSALGSLTVLGLRWTPLTRNS